MTQGARTRPAIEIGWHWMRPHSFGYPSADRKEAGDEGYFLSNE